jgi:hypothetical protein
MEHNGTLRQTMAQYSTIWFNHTKNSLNQDNSPGFK